MTELMRRKRQADQGLDAARNAGDEEAFRKLIESNLRFVVAMAKKYSRSGYPLHELINEGNMGLIEAASRFVAETGGTARIGALTDAAAVLAGEAGTEIGAGGADLRWY